jgi:hypothetical protein
MPESALATAATAVITLRKTLAVRGVRVLAWDGDVLYASRGYDLICWKAPSHGGRRASDQRWQAIASFRPAWWRNFTSSARLTSRLMRDGFHALAVLPDASYEHREDNFPTDAPSLIAAVPGAIVTRTSGSDDFRVTHKIRRGTRPLHITAVPSGIVYWGEYFDNRERAEVHIYSSADRGETWQVAYTFPAGAIRHIHNIVYDRWEDCLWILTGDEGAECKVLRASCDLRSVEVVLAGNQQARAVAAIPMADAIYLSTDTPFETNHVLRLGRDGSVKSLDDLPSSSISGCRVGESVFFSTMVEPSAVNRSEEVLLVGSADVESADVGSADIGSAGKSRWQVLARWQKDKWPMRYFQYGNAFLPDGENATNYLATTTVAVEGDDLVTTVWEVKCPPDTPMQRPLSA